MKPLTQGNLDGFCGIYSIINGLNLVHKISNPEAEILFSEIVRAIEDKKKKISDIAVDGLSDRDMAFVYREIIKKRYPVETYKPFHNRPDTDLQTYWNEIYQFLENGEKRVVNLAVERKDWSHWTVIHKVSFKSLYLWDSGERKKFLRNNCVTKPSGNGHLVLWPTTTRFLFRK